MIKAMFDLDVNRNVLGFEVTGHADAGPYGQDIVCAAVSVLMISTINGLEEVVGDHPEVVSNDAEGGYLSVQRVSSNHDSQILLKTLMNGIQDIVQSYPEHIVFNEVKKV